MLVDTSDSLVVVILESSASNPVVFSLRSMAVLVGRAKLYRRARAEKTRGDWGGSNLKNRLHGRGGFF